MRIILISVLIHIVALPVLAHFGAFKKIQRGLNMIETQLVSLPPPRRNPPYPTAANMPRGSIWPPTTIISSLRTPWLKQALNGQFQ